MSLVQKSKYHSITN